MKEVLGTIIKLRETSGNAKQAVLKQNDSPLLRKVLQYTLDPYKTWGVASYHASLTVGPPTTDDDWFLLFDRLAARQLTGNAAKAAIADHMSRATGSQQRVMERVLAKDLNCGVQVTTVNKVFPRLIPTFSVMLAKPVEQKRIKYPVYVETKHDGKRILAIATQDDCTLYSRNGHQEFGYQHIREQLMEACRKSGKDFVFDGELMFGMFGDRKKVETDADFMLFDLLTHEEFNAQKCTRPYSERQRAMTNLHFHCDWDKLENIRMSVGEPVNCWEQIEAVYREVVNNGGEGVMIKDGSALYEFKRSFAWMKVKPEESEDLKVVGVFGGEGKYQGMLGGVVVKFNGVIVRVGSGFADWQRKMYWEQIDADGNFEIVGKTVEVLYTEVTPDGSLRFPRFKCIRDDK